MIAYLIAACCRGDGGKSAGGRGAENSLKIEVNVGVCGSTAIKLRKCNSVTVDKIFVINASARGLNYFIISLIVA